MEQVEREGYMTKQWNMTKEDGKLFLISFFVGVFVYFAKIANELPNPDALWNGMAYKKSWSWEGSLGRYLIGYLQDIRGGVISTEFVSLTGILFLAAICVCVVKVFDITENIPRFLIAVLIILSPTVGATLTYYYCSDLYFLSYLLSTVAVLAAVKMQPVMGFVIYVFGICFSAAIYQGYLGVTITLCFFYLLHMWLEDSCRVKVLLKQAGRLLAGGVVGILLYLVSNQVIQRLRGIGAANERGFDSMGRIDITQLPELILNAYRGFFEYYFSSTMINNAWGGRRMINLLFFICAILLLCIVLYRKEMAAWKRTIFWVGLFLLPIPVMSIVFLAPEASIYGATGALMLPTMNYVYVFFVVLIWKQKHLLHVKMERVARIAVIGSCVLVCHMLLLLELSGQAYMKHHKNKIETVAYMVMDEIEEQVDHSERYKLCFIGNMEDGNYPEVYEDLRSSVHWTIAYYKTVWETVDGTQNCWTKYLSHYLGKKYQMCSQAEYDVITKSKGYTNMQNFPDQGSVTVVGNIIVIKLSDI